MASLTPTAHADTYAGVCTLELTVTYDGGIGPLQAGSPRVTINGSGPCTTPVGTKTGTLNGTAVVPLNLPLYTCAGGAGFTLTGATFSVAGYTGFNAATGALTVTIEAGVAQVSLTSTTHRFAGAGAFLQEPADTAACPTGGLTTTKWCGPFAFGETDSLVPPTEH